MAKTAVADLHSDLGITHRAVTPLDEFEYFLALLHADGLQIHNTLPKNLLPGIAEEIRIRLIDIHILAVERGKDEHRRVGMKRFGESLLALLERFLHPLAFGDITNDGRIQFSPANLKL